MFGSRTRKADRRSEVKPSRGGRIWKKKEWFATKYTPQPQTRRREQFSPILLFTHPFLLVSPWSTFSKGPGPLGKCKIGKGCKHGQKVRQLPKQRNAGHVDAPKVLEFLSCTFVFGGSFSPRNGGKSWSEGQRRARHRALTSVGLSESEL